jgi:hypothetical protein
LEINGHRKLKGIVGRMSDSNNRVISQGWNKLLESHRARGLRVREKVRFIVKTLVGKDLKNKLFV